MGRRAGGESEGTARVVGRAPPPSAGGPSSLSQAALDSFLTELNVGSQLDEAGVLDSFGHSWADMSLPLVPLDASGWETSDAGIDPTPVDFGSKHQFCEHFQHTDGVCRPRVLLPPALTIVRTFRPPAADNVLNESFFRSVPRVVRHALIQRVAALSSSTALGEAASMAFVLMFKAKGQPEGAQARQDLLAQSDHYFQAAVAALGEEGLSLEAQLTALADLQLCQVGRATRSKMARFSCSLHLLLRSRS